VFRAGIGRADVGELLTGVGRLIHIALEDFNRRIDQLRRHWILGKRPFERFVMFREGAFGHAGSEQSAQSVFLHNERVFPFSLVRHRRPGSVRHVADPPVSRPFQKLALGIVRFAVQITGSPVVKDSSVDGPGVRPVGEETQTCRVFLASFGHLVFTVGAEAAGHDPVAASG